MANGNGPKGIGGAGSSSSSAPVPNGVKKKKRVQEAPSEGQPVSGASHANGLARLQSGGVPGFDKASLRGRLKDLDVAFKAPGFNDRLAADSLPFAQAMQLMRVLSRLSPALPAVLDDAVIQDRMDAIHEAFSILPEDLNALSPAFNPRKFRDAPAVSMVYRAVFANLALIISGDPRWKGIQLYGKELAAAFARVPGKEADEAFGLSSLGALTIRLPDYFPLSKNPHRIRDSQKRFEIAMELFYLSRGNPGLASRILEDLLHLIEEVSPRDGVLLLRNLVGPVGFKGEDAILVRDYSTGLRLIHSFDLLTSPTIFPPENWTNTFLEGLRQKSWYRKTIAEVGTGTGAVPLYLARHERTSKAWSFDVNPDAKVVARLNAWLLSTDEQGFKRPGLQPVDLVHFADTPDLLKGAPPGLKVDAVIGCIPQVPSRDHLTLRNVADRYESLGYPENKDGLELVARLLEQSEPRLNPGGEVTLILSGRPGLDAVQQMAVRRRYIPRVVSETVFHQDRWTDLSSYTAMERSGIRPNFRFILRGGKSRGRTILSAGEAEAVLGRFRAAYLAQHTDEARDAVARNPEFEVSHSQYVVDFTPFTPEDGRFVGIADQATADWVRNNRTVGYTEDAGSEFEPLRAEQARHLSSLAGYQIPPEALFVGPTPEALLHHLIYSVTDFGSVIYLDPRLSLSSSLQDSRWRYTHDLHEQASLIVESSPNDPASLRRRLAPRIQKRQFTVFVLKPQDTEALQELSRIWEQDPEAKRYVSVFWRNTDLPLSSPLASLITWDRNVFDSMARLGEDSYSRVSTLKAVAEAAILSARNAKLPSPEQTVKRLEPEEGRVSLSSQAAALKSFKAHFDALSSHPDSDPIDMGFGESEFSIPLNLVNHFSDLSGETDWARDVAPSLMRRLRKRGWTQADPGMTLAGDGVHSLIYATLRASSLQGGQEGFSVLIPEGYYGQFLPTIHAAGGEGLAFGFDPQETDAQKIKDSIDRLAAQFDSAPPGAPPRAMLLQYPTNPEGLYYSTPALKALLDFCRAKRIYLLADEVFFETALSPGKSLFSWMADESYKEYFAEYVIGYTGLSKDYAFGGARLGAAFSANKNLLGEVSNRALSTVDPYALALARKIYASAPGSEYLRRHQFWLAGQRAKLLEALGPYAERGLIRYRQPEGGYFVSVDVSRLFGKEFVFDGVSYSIREDGSNFRQVLWQAIGIKVSEPGWSGKEGEIRLVYSIQRLEPAIGRLQRFLDAAGGIDARRELELKADADPLRLPPLAVSLQAAGAWRFLPKGLQERFIRGLPVQWAEVEPFFPCSITDKSPQSRASNRVHAEVKLLMHGQSVQAQTPFHDADPVPAELPQSIDLSELLQTRLDQVTDDEPYKQLYRSQLERLHRVGGFRPFFAAAYLLLARDSAARPKGRASLDFIQAFFSVKSSLAVSQQRKLSIALYRLAERSSQLALSALGLLHFVLPEKKESQETFLSLYVEVLSVFSLLPPALSGRVLQNLCSESVDRQALRGLFWTMGEVNNFPFERSGKAIVELAGIFSRFLGQEENLKGGARQLNAQLMEVLKELKFLKAFKSDESSSLPDQVALELPKELDVALSDPGPANGDEAHSNRVSANNGETQRALEPFEEVPAKEVGRGLAGSPMRHLAPMAAHYAFYPTASGTAYQVKLQSHFSNSQAHGARVYATGFRRTRRFMPKARRSLKAGARARTARAFLRSSMARRGFARSILTRRA